MAVLVCLLWSLFTQDLKNKIFNLVQLFQDVNKSILETGKTKVSEWPYEIRVHHQNKPATLLIQYGGKNIRVSQPRFSAYSLLEGLISRRWMVDVVELLAWWTGSDTPFKFMSSRKLFCRCIVVWQSSVMQQTTWQFSCLVKHLHCRPLHKVSWANEFIRIAQ